MRTRNRQQHAAVLLLVAIAIVPSLARAEGQTVGLFQNDEGSFRGYTLFVKRDAFLIDNDGMVVHSWPVTRTGVAYLLENGNLVRCQRGCNEVTWDGTEVWDFEVPAQHHDAAVMPNGNILMVLRETISAADAIAMGRDPARISPPPDDVVAPLHIIEVEKTGPTTGTIVWEWRTSDHLIQDFDPTKANYGVVAEHPELVDFNYPAMPSTDFTHTNGIDYNPALDQIVVSVRKFDELWIIDHSTTTEEAAGHTGGLSGMGGDLIYRWGNPAAYDRGDSSDRQLFLQHNTHWIVPGLSGEGNILLFNNGWQRPVEFSTIDQIVPPVSGFNYVLDPGPDAVYGPAAPVWTYQADPPTSFYSWFISGTGRLPNGNTLIDEGNKGTIFEVTPAGETVWKYVNPVLNPGFEFLFQGETVPIAEPPPQEQWNNRLYRAERYAPDYPGLAGRTLTPQGTLEQYHETAGLTMQSSAGGSATNPGEGDFSFGVGQLVTIQAEPQPCCNFSGWSVEPGSVLLDHPSSGHATFTMGAGDTTIQANFIALGAPGDIPPTMVMSRLTGGQLHLSWTSGCVDEVTSYAVYEGQIGSWSEKEPLVCDAGLDFEETVSPSPGDWFYLVVPAISDVEGSYGRDSNGVQRPPGTVTCASSHVPASCIQ